MTEPHDLIRIKSFLAAERQAIAALTAPDTFSAQMLKLAADYDLREQSATLPVPAVTESAQPTTLAPPAQRARNRFYNRRPAISPALLTAVVAAALIICAIGLTLPSGVSLTQRFSGLVEIKAAYAASSGIDVREGFIISASQPLSADLVEKSLQIYPGFDYRLEEQDAATYRVLPLEPLEQNTVYHLSFDPERVQEDQPVRAEYSWSFQTEAGFALTEISPTDTARSVPAGASLSVTFNEAVTLEAAAFISIEPQTAGEWQAGENSLYFLPAQGWDNDTLYTVFVTEGLPSRDGSLLGHGYTSCFYTEAPPADSAFSFSLAAQNAPLKPGEAPAWPLTLQDDDDGSPYAVELYALPDARAYAAALIGQADQLQTAELQLLAEYQIMALTAAEDDDAALTLPEGLSSGFYMAHILKQGCLRQMLFQVSSLDAYLSPGGGQRLLWLHDGAGAPLAGALISPWPGDEGQWSTDENGLALLPAASAQTAYGPVYCVEAGREALVLAGATAAPPLLAADSYRYELYTDQAAYAPGQTVNFFGVCDQKFGGGQSTPLQLSVRLKGIGGQQQPLPYSVSVTGGVFSGSLTLPGLRDGWYELALYAEESYLGGCFIQVGRRASPLCRLSVRPLTTIARAGEPVEWLVEALYGADTPLFGVTVQVEDMTSGIAVPVVTDESGQAVLTLPAARGAKNMPLLIQELRASADFPAHGTESASGRLSVLQYDAFIDAVLEPLAPDSYRLQLTPYTLTIAEPGAANAVRGAFNGKMTLAATLICHEEAEPEALDTPEDAPQEPAGPRTVEEFILELSGGQTFSRQLVLPRPGSYSLLLSGEDNSGQVFTLELSLSSGPDDFDAAPLKLKDAYTVRGEEHNYALDEQIQLRLYSGEAPLSPARGSRGLFVLAAEQVLATEITENGAAGLSFAAEYPTAITARAVYYADGRYVASEALPLWGEEIPAAYLTAEWEHITVEAGAAVHLSLRLSNAAGEGLAAVLNLNLLDQAAAESGLFVTLETDADGRAELEFTPPPAGGLWDLRWRAYAKEQPATISGSLALDLRPPLTLLSRFEGPFAVGDAPVLRLSAGGAAIQPEDLVSYQISLPELDFQYNISGTGGQWLEAPLPALPAGTYELSLIAVGGPYSDTKIIPFTVRQSFQGSYTLQQQPLKAGNPAPQDGEEDVTLIFSDAERAVTLAELFALAAGDSARLEHKLAARTAARLLERQFGWLGNQTDDGGLVLYQRENGGLAPLPQAAADKKLSALAAGLAAEEINRPALAEYLRLWYEQALDDTEQALALYGLAGLNQPVLLDIESMMEKQPSAMARLYLALAYTACGNGASAKALTMELLDSYTKETSGGLLQAAGLDNADRAALREATAYLTLLANIFELPQAQALYAGMRAYEQAGFIQTLAKAQVLAARCRTAPSGAYFSYRLEGQRYQISLREQGQYSLTLPAPALPALAFSNVAGDVVLSIISYQEGPPLTADAVEGPLPQIERYYQRQAAQTVELERGLTEIRLDFFLPADTPAGYYRVEDTLPAGLRFFALDTEASSRRVWLFCADSPTVSFTVYKGSGAYHGSVTYTAYLLMPGGYSAAAPLIQAVRQPQIIGAGETQLVEIK